MKNLLMKVVDVYVNVNYQSSVVSRTMPAVFEQLKH